MVIFEDRGTSHLQCRWALVGVRKNTLSVGVLGSGINRGLSVLLFPVKKQNSLLHGVPLVLQWRVELRLDFPKRKEMSLPGSCKKQIQYIAF